MGEGGGREGGKVKGERERGERECEGEKRDRMSLSVAELANSIERSRI